MKNQTKIKSKKLLWLIISTPILFIIIDLLKFSSPIQFTSDSINRALQIALIILFPILFLILVWRSTFSQKINWNIFSKIFLSLIFIFFYYFIFLVLMISLLLTRVDYHLYVHKNNKNKKIEKMILDGGALGGGTGGRIVEVNYFFPLLRYVSEVDTNEIDKNKWIKITHDGFR